MPVYYIMDLFEDAMTSEQRFMIMLQERLDALTDEVTRLTNMVASLQPIGQRPRNLRCADMGCSAACVFVRARVVDEEAATKFIKSLEVSERVASFGQFTRATRSLDYGPDDAASDEKTVQSLVLLDRTFIIGAFGASLCNADGVRCVEVFPVGDVVLSEDSQYTDTLFEYYMYHIAAGLSGKPLDHVLDMDVPWFYKDKGWLTWMLMGNITGCSDFDDLCSSLRARGALNCINSLPWHKKDDDEV